MLEPRILGRLVYFTAVVETQSFTRAAERLGITKAVVSQQVARLETDLGTALLVRTTRRLEPTDAGRLLFERASAILRDAGDALAEVSQTDPRPRGTLRILAPADYGALLVVPVVAEFLRRHPDCRADLRLADRIVDILDGEVDLSIRVGWLPDSSLHAKRLGSFQQFLVAAPAFRGRAEALASPADLGEVPLIVNAALPDPTLWRFTDESGTAVAHDAKALLTIDTTRGIHAAVLEGVGVAVLPDVIAEADIRDGRLIRVLPDWHLPKGGIHAVFPSARLRPQRVAAFIDLFAASLKEAATGRGGRPGPTSS